MFSYLVSHGLISVPHCLGDMCACPNGYNFHADRNVCGLAYISFPATGKNCELCLLTIDNNTQALFVIFFE